MLKLAPIWLLPSALVAVFFGSEFFMNGKLLEWDAKVLMKLSERFSTNRAQEDIVNDAYQRLIHYEFLIQKSHLLDGMVVNRHHDGTPSSFCDSLLFSNLRFVALSKLGFRSWADQAWSAILSSREGGHWYRHPRCKNNTSKDMLFGLLAGLTREPPGTSEHLRELLGYIKENRGFFSTGRVDVSYLMPGLAEILKYYIRSYDLDEDLPQFSYSFTTSELSVMGNHRGYRAHLVGLATWIELELLEHDRFQKGLVHQSLLAQPIIDFIRTLNSNPIAHSRLNWITHRLVMTDPGNLFFLYLRLKVLGKLTPDVKLAMLDHLLSKSWFPARRLPTSCDRKADYLWQRDSIEHVQTVQPCEEFSGVDFLFMTSLLIEEGDLRRAQFHQEAAFEHSEVGK